MVASRRLLLRSAAGLAVAAACAPRRAVAQVFTATSISQAAQDARRDVGQLARRADDLLRLTIADGAERGRNAISRFRADRASLTRELAVIFNGRVSEDDWLLVVPTRELELVLEIRPLFIRLAPTKDEVEASLKQPLVQIEMRGNDDAADVVLAIVLAALGFARRDKGLSDRLKGDIALNAALKSAAGAVKSHDYGLAAFELERLMWVIVQPRIVAAMTEQAGRDAPRTLYKSLVVGFVPFVGWTYFVTLLLATIYYNRDSTAPVLR